MTPFNGGGTPSKGSGEQCVCRKGEGGYVASLPWTVLECANHRMSAQKKRRSTTVGLTQTVFQIGAFDTLVG